MCTMHCKDNAHAFALWYHVWVQGRFFPCPSGLPLEMAQLHDYPNDTVEYLSHEYIDTLT